MCQTEWDIESNQCAKQSGTLESDHEAQIIHYVIAGAQHLLSSPGNSMRLENWSALYTEMITFLSIYLMTVIIDSRAISEMISCVAGSRGDITDQNT